MQLNYKVFYDNIRETLFRGSLSGGQVNGMNAIIGYCVRAYPDAKWLAYILATAYHETARTMQPVEEHGRGKGYDYGRKLKMSREAYTVPDVLYYGRGHVQLTWYENYLAFSRLLNVDLLHHPEKALVMDTSVKVLVEGMVRGMFTGKKLADYFIGTKADPVNARRIVNGRDKAELIAGYYRVFYVAITAAMAAAEPHTAA